MTATTPGVKGHCAHCDITFALKPWQFNAIALNEPFDCPYCHKVLLLSCPRQLRQLKSLDNLALLRPSMRVLTCVALLVALVVEWVGLISKIGQLNVSLVAILIHFLTLRYARHRHRLTLTLEAINPVIGRPVKHFAGVAGTRLGQR